MRRSAARMLRSPTASAGRSVTDYPLTVRHRNGTLTHVLCSASVYRDFNGEVLGVLAAARDMTKPQEAFEATQGRPPPREPKDPVRTVADMAPCRGEHLNRGRFTTLEHSDRSQTRPGGCRSFHTRGDQARLVGLGRSPVRTQGSRLGEMLTKITQISRMSGRILVTVGLRPRVRTQRRSRAPTCCRALKIRSVLRAPGALARFYCESSSSSSPVVVLDRRSPCSGSSPSLTSTGRRPRSTRNALKRAAIAATHAAPRK